MELGYILNINARRVKCINGKNEQLRNNEDIIENWNEAEAMINIAEEEEITDEEEVPNYAITSVDNDNRSHIVTMLFSGGEAIKNLRIQESWTLRELYMLLFVNN
jgi:hypothetical protein